MKKRTKRIIGYLCFALAWIISLPLSYGLKEAKIVSADTASYVCLGLFGCFMFFGAYLNKRFDIDFKEWKQGVRW